MRLGQRIHGQGLGTGQYALREEMRQYVIWLAGEVMCGVFVGTYVWWTM